MISSMDSAASIVESHLGIINNYEGSCMGKIAKKLDRSAATVHAQIRSHDESTEKMGYCVECRRLKGKHDAEKTGNRSVTTSSQ